MIAFGGSKQWRVPLLAASRACAEQVFAEAKAYNAAFDAGLFAS